MGTHAFPLLSSASLPILDENLPREVPLGVVPPELSDGCVSAPEIYITGSRRGDKKRMPCHLKQQRCRYQSSDDDRWTGLRGLRTAISLTTDRRALEKSTATGD
ncbi:hypothetical protein EYF80_038120 [Liparis tanakae]|uniref:Uncharacterized protein n=1 Tax=Liparis tanakae TaxID=230148 RepID=A0A4Z2GDU3_9TELE|nr:hypothetical protein EYF80_038120 [Liparis tanakae]